MIWFAFAKNRVTIWRDHYPSDIACAQAVGTLRRHFAGSEVDVRESTMPVVQIEPLEGDETSEFKAPAMAELAGVSMLKEPVESSPGMIKVTTETPGHPPVTVTMVTEAFPDFEAVPPVIGPSKEERVWQSAYLWVGRGKLRRFHRRHRLVIWLPPIVMVASILLGNLWSNGIPAIIAFLFLVTFGVLILGLPYWIIKFIDALAGLPSETIRHRSRN